MKRADDDTVLAALREAAAEPDLRLSSLHAFMREHHDALAELLLGMTWERATRVFTAMGFTMATGAPLTANRVCKTWWRAHRAMEKRSGRMGKRGSVRPATEGDMVSAPSSSPSTPAPDKPFDPMAAFKANLARMDGRRA